ncbi:MAG: hypothetical protein ACTHJ5_02580 [Ilyomonas sp.]
MKKLVVVLVSFAVMVGLPFCIHFVQPNGSVGHSLNQQYYLMNYRNASDLYERLWHCLTTDINSSFLWCCDCILFYAKALHLSYEELNIYLFIIWQPYLIILFFVLFILQNLKYRRLKKTFQTKPF